MTKQNIYLISDMINLFYKNAFLILYSVATIIETWFFTYLMRNIGKQWFDIVNIS